MKKKLPIWDQRMLLLMDYCLANKLTGTREEFLQSIGMHKTGVYQVKRGVGSFRLEHFYAAAKKYSVNMNWFFGLDTEMIFSRKKKALPAITRLKEAVLAVEIELRK